MDSSSLSLSLSLSLSVSVSVSVSVCISMCAYTDIYIIILRIPCTVYHMIHAITCYMKCSNIS